MGFFFLPISILLFSFTFWLWRLRKEQTAHFAVKTRSLGNRPFKAEISSLPQTPSPIMTWLKPFIPFIQIGFVLWIILSIFIFLIKGPIWITLIALILTLAFMLPLLLYFYELLGEKIELHATPLATVEFLVGEATLPKKVYLGDSQNILLSLKTSFMQPGFYNEKEGAFQIQDNKSGKLITLHLRREATTEEFLEIELLAAALTVDGEKKQQQRLNLLNKPRYSYRWNCFFPNSGNHTIVLIFRLICSSDVFELGEIEHTIKVLQLDHLTRQQVLMLATTAGVVGCLSTIIGIIVNIPSLLHIFSPH